MSARDPPNLRRNADAWHLMYTGQELVPTIHAHDGLRNKVHKLLVFFRLMRLRNFRQRPQRYSIHTLGSIGHEPIGHSKYRPVTLSITQLRVGSQCKCARPELTLQW